MIAEILAIGTELLGASRLDTNSLELTRELAALGVEVVGKHVLPDRTTDLAAAIAAAMARVPLVICTGGLGPTEDDRTREAAALALGCSLVRDPVAETWIRGFFAQRQRAMPPANLRQADRLAPAAWLPNPTGTAPGQWCPTPAGWLVLLPGPPREMREIFHNALRPRLLALAPQLAFYTSVLCLASVSESDVDAIAAPLYRVCDNPETTILATGEPQIELRFRASASTPDAAHALADGLAQQVESQLIAALGDVVIGHQSEPLATAVGRCLAARGQTLAVAESCTGGLLGARLTDAPGASEFFLGGVISYSNSAKVNLLGVSPGLLDSDGAVSAACAGAMAEGVRARFAADWGLAVTGIAGPSGATPSKPVGTVYIGLAAAGQPAEHVHLALHGDRDRIRRFSAQRALHELFRHLR